MDQGGGQEMKSFPLPTSRIRLDRLLVLYIDSPLGMHLIGQWSYTGSNTSEYSDPTRPRLALQGQSEYAVMSPSIHYPPNPASPCW